MLHGQATQEVQDPAVPQQVQAQEAAHGGSGALKKGKACSMAVEFDHSQRPVHNDQDEIVSDEK